MLNRNLERRVEAFVEAVTPDTREQLNVILDALRADREKAWEMQPDGVYLREEGGEGTSSQEALYRYFSTRKVSLQDSEVESPSESAKSESLKQEQEKAEQEKPVAEKNESEKEESDAPRWNIFNSWLHRRS